MQTAHIQIDGMTCTGCTASVQKALQAQTGVSSVSISLEDGMASVDYDETLVNQQQLLDAIEAAGFDATLTSL